MGSLLERSLLIQTHFGSVGKSSLLNALLGKHVVRASRTPGKTKSLQTIYWTPEVRLVDCPGLVFPSLVGMENQVLSGLIPIQNVEAVIHEVGQKMPLEEILQVQKLEDAQGEEWSTDSLLSSLAVQRGEQARYQECGRNSHTDVRCERLPDGQSSSTGSVPCWLSGNSRSTGFVNPMVLPSDNLR